MPSLPASGTITLDNVNATLSIASGSTIGLADTNVRTLFGVPSGSISLSQGYGKGGRPSLSVTISANTQNASVNVAALSGYVAGSTDVTITVGSGVYCWSDSTASAGLSISGGTAGDVVSLVNNGYIIGKGGTGQGITTTANVATGSLSAGGPGLSLSCPVTVTNNSYIAGGGGGGAACYTSGGGGGAGGGLGGASNTGTGGTGGDIGIAGSNGGSITAPTAGWCPGGGGGRILPGNNTVQTTTVLGGTTTISSTGGGGNTPGSATWVQGTYTTGMYAYLNGLGGSAGGSGGLYTSSTYALSSYIAGGGGGWGASGGTAASNYPTYVSGTGAAGGPAVQTNGNTVSWVTIGNRYGAVV